MIVILDFGSQFAHLIAKRIQQLGICAEILPGTSSAEIVNALNPEGIILSGGPASVYEENAPQLDPDIYALNIPILGVCYGMHLIGKRYGTVERGTFKEYGRTIVRIEKRKGILGGLSEQEEVWMSHGDQITRINDFEILASSQNCKHAAIANEEKRIFGVQFHPEVAHTVNGMKVLENFTKICNAKRDFSISDRKEKIIKEIKEAVQGKSVLMAISGGVDSTVAAVLLYEAIGNRLHCVFVDHGFMRKGEKEKIDEVYQKMFSNYYSIDATNKFIKKIEGITEPEEKRKVIGHTFIEIFEEKAKELKNSYPDIEFLGQGTIYPDRIESAQPTNAAAKIKSHHNLTLPEKMQLKLIEPLREFYKDDVRILGKELDIPLDILKMHPFPGPGLAIRVIGEVTKERLELVREADAIFIEELKREGLYQKVWQALAALFPIRTVGVMGDARTYDHVISLRAVTSQDAMSADWAKLPPEFLKKVSSRIVNEVKGINRVVYDITQKPPGTIEYE